MASSALSPRSHGSNPLDLGPAEANSRIRELLRRIYRQSPVQRDIKGIDQCLEVTVLVNRSIRESMQALEDVVKDEFISIAQGLELPSHETEFLNSTHRKLHDVRTAAWKVATLYQFMNNVFEEGEVGPKRALRLIYDFHMTKIREVLLPIVRTRVQRNGIRHIISGGYLNTLWASAFASKDGRSIFQGPVRLRRVYLALNPLASKDRGSSSTTGQASTSLRLPDSLRRLPFRIATVQHWALIIGSPILPVISTQEVETPHGSLHQAATHPELPGLRCELVREGYCTEINCTEVDTSQVMSTRGLDYQLLLIGCTFFSNEELMKEAREVLERMPANYHVSRNNCQKFCMELFHRVRVPTMKEEVLTSRNGIRRKLRKRTMNKRRVDFVRLKTLEAVVQTPRNLPSFRQLPLAVESAVDTTLGIMICAVIFSAWKQLAKRSFALLLAALLLGYLHGNYETCRPLMRAREMAVLQEEGLDKAIEDIINELSPLNDMLTEGLMEICERQSRGFFEIVQQYGIRGIRRD